MPHLVKMDRRYAKKGLRIIGAEVQGSSPESIKAFAKEHRIKFPITQGVSGPNLTNGIPHVAVFDVEGKLVFSGHPANEGFEDSVKKELKRVESGESDAASGLDSLTTTLIAEREWTNREGKTLRASLLSVEGQTGTFRRPNGQTFQFAIDQLGDGDQATIRAALDAKDR